MKLGKVKEIISRAPKENSSHPIKSYHREHLCIWCYWHLPNQPIKTQHFVIPKKKKGAHTHTENRSLMLTPPSKKEILDIPYQKIEIFSKKAIHRDILFSENKYNSLETTFPKKGEIFPGKHYIDKLYSTETEKTGIGLWGGGVWKQRRRRWRHWSCRICREKWDRCQGESSHKQSRSCSISWCDLWPTLCTLPLLVSHLPLLLFESSPQLLNVG